MPSSHNPNPLRCLGLKQVVRRRIRSVIPHNVAAMSIPERELTRVWQRADPTGSGSLTAQGLHRVLQALAVVIGPGEVAAFVHHIAGLRHQDMPTAGLPRDRVTYREFLSNRAKLFATPQPSNSQKIRRGQESNISQGLPPKRVANATYGGSDSDKALGKQLLDRLTSQVLLLTTPPHCSALLPTTPPHCSALS